MERVIPGAGVVEHERSEARRRPEPMFAVFVSRPGRFLGPHLAAMAEGAGVGAGFSAVRVHHHRSGPPFGLVPTVFGSEWSLHREPLPGGCSVKAGGGERPVLGRRNLRGSARVSSRRPFPGTPPPLAPPRPPRSRPRRRRPGAPGSLGPSPPALARGSPGLPGLRPSPPDPRGRRTGCRSRCCCCPRGHPTLGPPLRRPWTHRPPRLPLSPRRKALPPLLPQWRGPDPHCWAATCSSTPTGFPTRTRCHWRRSPGAHPRARHLRWNRPLARATVARSAPVSLPAPCGCRATVYRTRTSSPSRAVPAARPSSAPATCPGTAPRTVPARAHRTRAHCARAASRTPRSWRSTCASTKSRPGSGPRRPTHTAAQPHTLPGSAEATALPWASVSLTTQREKRHSFLHPLPFPLAV